jgi:hypothetical protein
MKPSGSRHSTAAIAPAFSAERTAAWRSRPPAGRRTGSPSTRTWPNGETSEAETLSGELFRAKTLGSEAAARITTDSEETSRGEKRICGTPQPGQKGDLSSTAAPHPWQRCSNWP